MNNLSLIFQSWLILIFLLAGCLKLFLTRDKMIASGASWAEDFGPFRIKLLGLLETALALLQLLTILFPVSSVFAMLSAVVMGFIMFPAAFQHIRRKEYGFLVLSVATGLIAFYVAWQKSSV